MPLWLARVILWTPVPLLMLCAAWQVTKNEPDRFVSWLKLSGIIFGTLAVAAGIVTAFVVAVVTVWQAP